MSNRADEIHREKIGLRFIAALDDGDLETLASLWEKAVEDADLGRLFCELTEAVYDDELAEPRSAGEIPESPAARDTPAQELVTVPTPPRAPSMSGRGGMLVLSRKLGEQVVIGDNITVTVVKIQSTQVRLGISAPASMPVHRQEVYELLKQDPSSLGRDLTYSEE
jgi:carbon storage regulator